MDKKGAAEPCQATEWFCAAVTRDDDILMAVFCFFFFPACFSHKHVLDLLKLLSLKVWFLVLDTQRNFVFNRCFCHLGKLGCDICVDLSTEEITSI